MSERDVVERSEFIQWLDAPAAAAARKFFSDQLVAAELKLIAACKTSADPNVRAAYESKFYLQVIVNYLKGKTE